MSLKKRVKKFKGKGQTNKKKWISLGTCAIISERNKIKDNVNNDTKKTAEKGSKRKIRDRI